MCKMKYEKGLCKSLLLLDTNLSGQIMLKILDINSNSPPNMHCVCSVVIFIIGVKCCVVIL